MQMIIMILEEPLTMLCFLQLVSLTNIHGPTYLVLSTKAKRDLLYAINEVGKSDAFNHAERKCLAEIGKTLRQFWS